ncbi:hypothetical protein BDK51DRAFT_39652 [Blyttiomyces helicus]|uniref:Uncharacterized protein n=1 Tax=Blyttiomyces helicus TaxID=388810 RepID=A0A4P9WBS9_9FUNG|nr:hypothetical protein BDK51DRAFT_39652 [Blyttiomyces helicus]|eukprot:RKO88380.1 hypothetical protein BDK51DRAFT_39652 [Blyttiomyces helicus]
MRSTSSPSLISVIFLSRRNTYHTTHTASGTEAIVDICGGPIDTLPILLLDRSKPAEIQLKGCRLQSVISDWAIEFTYHDDSRSCGSGGEGDGKKKRGGFTGKAHLSRAEGTLERGQHDIRFCDDVFESQCRAPCEQACDEGYGLASITVESTWKFFWSKDNERSTLAQKEVKEGIAKWKCTADEGERSPSTMHGAGSKPPPHLCVLFAGDLGGHAPRSPKRQAVCWCPPPGSGYDQLRPFSDKSPSLIPGTSAPVPHGPPTAAPAPPLAFPAFAPQQAQHLTARPPNHPR